MMMKIFGDIATLFVAIVITIVVGLLAIGLTALNNHFMNDDK